MTRVVDIFVEGGQFQAGVAKLGQRRWDEVPVLNGSQVQILPPAPILFRLVPGIGTQWIASRMTHVKPIQTSIAFVWVFG